MEPASALAQLGIIIVAGIGAQWLAWRFRLPGIILLIVFGFALGPATGILAPDELLGSFLQPFVSLAVAIILFEGGLGLDMAELRSVGKAVRNLVTIGVVVTAVLATSAAHYVAGLSWELSIVLGSLLVVTGPTVILPMLRQLKLKGQAGSILKWEGILTDPIGALFAILVLEALILRSSDTAWAGVAIGV